MGSITPINTNWYQDITWTGTITPAITTAQSNYTTAANSVNAYTTTYTTSKTALQDAIDAINTPPTTLAEVSTLEAARDDFNLKQTEYNTRLATLQTKSEELIAAYRQAQTHVDTEGDTLLESYITELSTTAGLQLARTGVDTNTLPDSLSDANDARQTARTEFTDALDSYQSAENALSLSKIELLALYDQKLLAEAEVAIRQGYVDLAQETLDIAQADLDAKEQTLIDKQDILDAAQLILDGLTPLDPGYAAALIAVNNATANRDLALSERDAAIIVRDDAQQALDDAEAFLQVAIDELAAVQTQVTTQEGVVAGAESTRNSLKTALDAALLTYNDAIDDLLQVLEDAYDLHTGIPAQFVQSLDDARTEAQTLVDATLAAYIQHDIDLKNALTAAFPNTPPPSTATKLNEIRVQTTQIIDTVIRTTDASQPTQIISAINLPALPPPNGKMSMSDLMRFIAAVQLAISRLALAIRQSDNTIDSMRMRVWDLQNAYEVERAQTLYGYAMTVIQADEDYNVTVGFDNAAMSEEIITALNDLLTNPGTALLIQQAIDQLNSDIDDQNQRGIDVTTALNNSYFIAVDTINENQNVQPPITNTADIFDEEPDTTIGAQRTDITPFDPPDTIDHYDDFNPGNYLPLPDNFPTPEPVLDPAPGVQPVDPSAPPVYVPPDELLLPTQMDIDDLNTIIENVNDFLYPIRERLAAEGVNFELIDKFYLRPYTPVRQISDIIDLDQLNDAIKVYTQFVEQQQAARTYAELSDKGQALSPFNKALDQSRVAVTEGQHKTGEPVGSGAGILSANILASSVKVDGAVQLVLNSTDFRNEIANYLQTAALIGGLQTATQIPSKIANYSQMGLVRSDLADDIGEIADGRVEAAGQLSETDKKLALNTAKTVLEGAGDIDALKQKVIELVQKAGDQDLNKEELEQLIAALLYILQLLQLLVAALLLAAVGGVDLQAIINQAFQQPPNIPAEKAIQDLRDLGISGLNTLDSRSLNFVSDFAAALLPLLPASQQIAFTSQVSDIFARRGVTFTFDPAKDDIRSKIAEAIAATPNDVRDQIRRDIIQSEIENSQLYRQDTARSELQRLAVLLFGQTETTPSTQPQTPSLLASTATYTPLSPQTLQLTERNLENNAPQVPGLTPQERNTIIIAVATGLISAAQGTTLVNSILTGETVGTDQALSFAQARALQEGKSQQTSAAHAGATIATPSVPQAAGIVGNTSSPQALPEDIVALLRTTALVLTRQADDDRFAHTALTSVANELEPLTNFVYKFTHLIIEPAGIPAKMFSVVTRDDAHMKFAPLSSPLSG